MFILSEHFKVLLNQNINQLCKANCTKYYEVKHLTFKICRNGIRNIGPLLWIRKLTKYVLNPN